MSVVFGDAGFWIALRDPKDQFHGVSVRVAQEFFRQRVRLMMTPLVFAEVYAQFSRARRTREQVVRDCWNNPVVQMEHPTFADHEKAMEILREHADKTYSFCDAVSFALMLRLEVQASVSFDDHFRQFGRFRVINGIPF